jgi:2-C-methyl-D-erythritol 2,4-cyclodiphosphate synthase
MIRIGQGYDLHKLVPRSEYPDATPLIIGGIKISDEIGTIAHSDGDVLLHALIDGLLGTLALGDIGDHFPPSDDQYKNADSSQLLQQVLAMPEFQNITIENVDSTLFLEAPKLGTNKLAIREKLAELLKLPLNRVSVKAKTMEGLGAIGSKQAVAASVTVAI